MATAVWRHGRNGRHGDVVPSRTSRIKRSAARGNCAALFVWLLDYWPARTAHRRRGTGERLPCGPDRGGAAPVPPRHDRCPKLTYGFIVVVLFDRFRGCDLTRRRLRAGGFRPRGFLGDRLLGCFVAPLSFDPIALAWTFAAFGERTGRGGRPTLSHVALAALLDEASGAVSASRRLIGCDVWQRGGGCIVGPRRNRDRRTMCDITEVPSGIAASLKLVGGSLTAAGFASLFAPGFPVDEPSLKRPLSSSARRRTGCSRPEGLATAGVSAALEESSRVTLLRQASCISGKRELSRNSGRSELDDDCGASPEPFRTPPHRS